MGNKQNTYTKLSQFDSQTSTKEEKIYDVNLFQDKPKAFNHKAQMKLGETIITISSKNKALIISHSYNEIDSWGSKETRLFLKINGKMRIFDTNKAKEIHQQLTAITTRICQERKITKTRSDSFLNF
ncbi:hypothetical protein M0813_08205 [Anaeramoeba flamelloides]|uniref:IRS-type PTB domain-containing protein n=1 Tax=Anaeramoeba flamelloides TaxID=1746091 RepID=A0ABQ8X812_9EUKA|nr:hypothetical protein M0813_08205 [Anaeramoeba flamelloides]